MSASVGLYLAAFLAVAVGVAHSVLGERYILIRLFRRTDLPKLFGGPEFTVRTLRFAWHITTIAWFGLAGILVLLAHPPVSSQHVAITVAVTFLATSAAILVGSRGKHLAWPVFLVMGVVTLVFSGGDSAGEARQRAVTKRDFFFYSCVHEYMAAHSIRNFDGSLAYAVEYSDLSAEELTRLHNSAKAFARTIGPPDYTDEEHGLRAVLVLCQQQAAGNGG